MYIQQPIILTPDEALQIASDFIRIIDSAPEDLKAGVDMRALQQQFNDSVEAQKQKQLELNYDS